MVQYDEMGEIKKGPWKVEEDEVLIKHVNKYGPREWSSIRSKGLLQRTGKSCRLRWVNKLRPDLKTGVKFSAEEERTVIDLQAQFGNKWAKIATYLQGRTDNDVKNFWSSRKKRLARILHTSTPSSIKPLKNTKQPQITTAFHNLNSSTDKDSLPKLQLRPYWNTVYPTPAIYQHTALPLLPVKKPLPEQQLHLSFPQFPLFQPDFPLLIESHDFITRHENPCFLDEFEDSTGSVLGTAQIPIAPSFVGPKQSCQFPGAAESLEIGNLVDDFPPMEIFDQIEPLPSPSEWS